MSDRQIIGVVLVRNEDAHLRQSVENVVKFCDRIFLLDHGSTDRTPQIIADLAALHPHIEAHPIARPRESHDFIKGYAGTETWVFGVDGDEIYDPAGLAQMRTRLIGGEFDDSWMILGNVLNCDRLDPAARTASGYTAPPCRSITKLYNFRLIRSWDGDTPERLHGGTLVFQPGHDASARLSLHEQIPWEHSPLRCLHACFVPRSSQDGEDRVIRENLMDIHTSSPLLRLRRWWKGTRGKRLNSEWKKSRYHRGEQLSIDASPFFP
jgi:glycosyltransferase involved in cell wall biosynthesis